jgi:SAM-dependent methyltransferase
LIDPQPLRERSPFRQDRLERLSQIEDWHFWFVSRRELVAFLLRRQLDAKANLIVDVGCGNGAMLPLLFPLARRVLGLDRLPKGLLRLSVKQPRAWRLQGEAEHLPLDSGVADAVVALDVLEHVDDRAALADIRRVLRPGGVALMTVPALPWLWSYRDEDAGHLRRYGRNDLVQLLETSGFEIRRINYYQCLLFPAVVVARLLGRRGPKIRDVEERRMPFLNAAMTAINRLETRLGSVLRWPFGSSLVAVCRKPPS